MIIVDASVAVKWFVPEEHSDQAVAVLRSGQRLLAPDLIRFEVAATFTRLLHLKNIDQRKAEILLNKWRQYLVRQAVALEDTSKHLEEAEALSVALSHPLQNCLYLAVANRLESPLITADKQFFEKTIAAGYQVNLLAEQSF